LIRTDMHCHECENTFIAQFEEKLNGNHIATCPYCFHEHCRVIIDGVISEVRWDHQRLRIDADKVWKSQTNPPTKKAALFIRDKWLERL
jgi:hypothetical protein